MSNFKNVNFSFLIVLLVNQKRIWDPTTFKIFDILDLLLYIDRTKI